MDSNLTNMHSEPRLYLDHAATTPIVDAARTAILQAMEIWANPSSPHEPGRAARAMLEDARARIARALNWDGEVIFTSGATEAIKIALSAGDVRICGVEHDAILSLMPGGPYLAVGGDGLVDLGQITGPARYAIQSVNNENGVIQPVAEIAAKIREGRGVFFSDCSQSAGKMPLPDADLIAICGHKLGGPPGIGLLLTRDLALLNPSGGQEQGYRRGTENLPYIMGLAAALEADFGWMDRAAKLRARLDRAILDAGGQIVAADSPRIATIAGYHMPGVSASSQLIGFDMAGIAVSAGSACSSGTLKTSHVLGAMGWDAKSAAEVVRVSFGPTTCDADIDRFMAAWVKIFARAKAQ